MPPFTRRAKQPRTNSRNNPSSASLATSSRSAVFLEEIIIPDDVLIEILKRIPLKALVQFTCVCKSWLDLLSSPTFTAELAVFNSSSINFDNQNFCMHLFKEPVDIHSDIVGVKFSVYNAANFDGLSLAKPEKIRSPLRIGLKDFVVCSADGVLCFFDFFCPDPVVEPLMLWNPSLKKGIAVNAPPPTDGILEFTCGGFPKLIFGFGFDPVMNDHVLVRVGFFCGGGYWGGGEYGTTILKADVYGVNLESWKRVDVASVLREFRTIRWRGVCVNRVIHWVGNLNVGLDEKGRVCKSILTFKLGSQVFGVIDLPNDVVDVSFESVRVVSVPKDDKDMLGVIHSALNIFSLWVMTNGVRNTWIKLFSIDIGFKIVNDMNVAVLNDEVVVVKRVFMELKDWISYDCGSLVKQDVKAISVALDYVDRYVESLVLFRQQNGVLPWSPPPPRPPPARSNWRIYSARCRRMRAPN